MSYPHEVLISVVAMLLLAPRRVTSPQRHAQKDKAQTSVSTGRVLGTSLARIVTIWIMVVVYDILLINADMMTLTHMINVMTNTLFSANQL